MKYELARNAVCPTKVAVTVAALIAAIGLSACGGGGNDVAAVKRESGGSPIKVDGQSRSVEAVDGRVAVLLPPTPSSNYGVFSSDMGGSISKSVDAALLSEAAAGAYMQFGDKVKLLSGTITDLSGTGQYAIGRWADGTDSEGRTYNVNQGRVWVVGQPVTPRVSPGSSLICALETSTRPVAIDGNTPPGRLRYANAVVDFTDDGFEPSLYTVRLTYDIGNDALQMMSSSVRGEMSTSRVNQQTLLYQFFGTDPAKPYLGVAYTTQSPTAGTIHGVAVMACTRNLG